MNSLRLLSPFKNPFIGQLKNRVVMSAMTRGFAAEGHLCTPDISAYYARRAEAGVGLILTEGIIIHPSADGYNSVTHLHTARQMESWRSAVKSVHQHGTKIYAQLWHCGRISHPDYTSGFDVVSSSDEAATGINRQNQKPYGRPRALTVQEMPGIYKMFSHSAELAMNAGFDGVQLHMGHGYLIDQFLDARINNRVDDYGGSVENRARFALELLDVVAKAIGIDRVMIRISPSRMMGGLYEWPGLEDLLSHLLENFDRAGLRQLDISCANADYFQTSGKVIRAFRAKWPHLMIGGASLSVAAAEQEIKSGYLDLVTWGRAILANPDFVRRISGEVSLRTFEDGMRAELF